LSGAIELSTAAAGLDVVGWLPPGSSDAADSRNLMSHGIEARPLSHYRIRKGRPGLVLGAAAFDEATIRRAVSRMAAAFENSDR
jgi:GntR family transcriptional regulator/MocR family aminotransferase